MSAGFAFLQRFLRETSGLSLDDDKRYLLEDRLQTVMQAHKLSGLDDLAQALHANRRSELARTVTEALTINETSFFRDRGLFAAIKERLLPDLVSARAAERRLRIWCAGCSTGQEPYSLAMLIDEHVRQLHGWQIEIVASDISRRAIETARRGLFTQFEVQRGLPVGMLLRHFRQEGNLWQISEQLRAKISFETRNLLVGYRELGTFDMIFCRNVLIYFDAPTKRQALGRLADVLSDDGYLALGGAERVGGSADRLLPDPTSPFIFRKVPAPKDALFVGLCWA